MQGCQLYHYRTSVPVDGRIRRRRTTRAHDGGQSGSQLLLEMNTPKHVIEAHHDRVIDRPANGDNLDDGGGFDDGQDETCTLAKAINLFANLCDHSATAITEADTE